MTQTVALVEVDDVAASEVRGGMRASRPHAEGFPRDDDLLAIDGRDRGALAFLIVVDGVVVGTCGTHGPADPDGTVEVGWGIVATARGRGVGTMAVAQLLEELRTRTPDATVVARTEWCGSKGDAHADSVASERILARLGFSAGPAPRGPGERAWSLQGASPATR